MLNHLFEDTMKMTCYGSHLSSKLHGHMRVYNPLKKGEGYCLLVKSGDVDVPSNDSNLRHVLAPYRFPYDKVIQQVASAHFSCILVEQYYPLIHHDFFYHLPVLHIKIFD